MRKPGSESVPTVNRKVKEDTIEHSALSPASALKDVIDGLKPGLQRPEKKTERTRQPGNGGRAEETNEKEE